MYSLYKRLFFFGDMNDLCFTKGKPYIIEEISNDYVTLIDNQNDQHDIDLEYINDFFNTGFIFGR